MLNIHTHTEYSEKDAISKVEQVAKRHLELGVNSFCITDHGTFSSFPTAFKVAKELGMKFIPGIEAYLKPDDSYDLKEKVLKVAELTKELRKKSTPKERKEDLTREINEINSKEFKKNFHITLLAYNQKGLNNLFKIYSEGHLYYKNRIEKESLVKHKEGVIVLSGCYGGELSFYIKSGDIERAEALAREYKEIFGHNYFIEIMYHGIDTEKDLLKGHSDEITTYKKMIEIALKYDIPMVATNDSHYIMAEDETMYGVYKSMCYFKSEDAKTGELGLHGTGYHLVTEEELKERFISVGYSGVDSMFENVRIIEEKVEDGIDIQKSTFLRDVMDELEEKVLYNWEKKRKGTEYEKESWDRLHYELEVIRDKNFSNYFLKTYLIIERAYELGILTGPGRGSGAGSEVVYLLGITKTDPLKYHLLFERFLNPARKGMPDIDSDIESEYIKEDGTKILGSEAIVKSLDDVFKFNGRINNVVKGSSIMLFKKLASWCDVRFQDANKFTTSDIGLDILECKDKPTKEVFFKALNSLDIINDQNKNEWEECYKYLDVVFKLKDIVFGRSIHASGVIMAEDEVILPVNDAGVIDFNGDSIEKYDYIKFDMLSLDTLNPIKHFYGIDVDWNDVDDPKVWDTFERGELDFVFQFAGFVPTEMCKKGHPRSIEKLGEINAINRPGPLNMNLNKVWIDIQNDQYEFDGNQKIIAELLRNRFGDDHTGLLVYQEDVMFVCVDGAGFTLSEADDIRKAMGKKKDNLIAPYKQPFIDGWRAKGTAGNPEEIWEDIREFAKYAFNKSHAIAYSIIGYQTAKLWTYHKEEFLQWMINYGTTKRKKQAIEFCQKSNMNLNFPSLNVDSTDTYQVDENSLTLPHSSSGELFKYYSDFLFSDLPRTEKLQAILKGMLDKMTIDRKGLYELISTVPEKSLFVPNFPQENGLSKILSLGKVANLWEIKDEEANYIEVTVKKPRSQKDIKIYKSQYGLPKENLEFNIKNDIKNFNLIKPGQLSQFPEFDSDRFFMKYYSLKDKLMNGKNIQDLEKKEFYDIKKSLSNCMKLVFCDDRIQRKVSLIASEEKTAYFISGKFFKEYGYMKATIRFDDGDHIFYIRDNNMIEEIVALNKNTIIYLSLVLECYINKELLPVVTYKIKEIINKETV